MECTVQNYLNIFLLGQTVNSMNIKRWDTIHCMVLLVAAAAFVFTGNLLLIVIPAFASFVFLLYHRHDELKTLHPYGGWANRITFIRLIAIVALAFLHKNLSDLQITCWLGLLIPLDGLDGYLARKRGEQTLTGAWFDMETDVFFVCLASCLLFQRSYAGFEILIVGFIRYFYVTLVFILKLNHIPEKKTQIGPVIAVIVFITVSISFVLPDLVRKLTIYTALILLLISFSYSFWLLLNNKSKLSN